MDNIHGITLIIEKLPQLSELWKLAGIDKVWIFGSRIKGYYTEESDYDLAWWALPENTTIHHSTSLASAVSDIVGTSTDWVHVSAQYMFNNPGDKIRQIWPTLDTPITIFELPEKYRKRHKIKHVSGPPIWVIKPEFRDALFANT